MTNTKQIKIDDTDVFLENFGVGNGKITISDSYNHNYSYHWGAMGSCIEKFLLGITSDYFARKLIPDWDERVIDVAATFKNLRGFIRDELDLPFYKEILKKN